jgi:phosphate:Na+ symporter
MVWLPFIGFIADLVTGISPTYPDLSGADRLAAETPRQIANAHTFFNVANTLIFVWFTTQIARIVEWLVPDKPLEEEAIIVRTKFLQEELLSTPSLALDQVRMEVMHMGETVNAMLRGIMPAIIKGDRQALEEIRQMDDTVDILHAGIIDYLGKISKQQLTEEQSRELLQLMEAVSNLENIGDIIETNLVVLGHDRIKDKVEVSETTQRVLNGFQQSITKAVAAAVQAVGQRNQRAAQVVTGMKDEINQHRRFGSRARSAPADRRGTQPHPGVRPRSRYHREAETHLLLRQAHGQDGSAGSPAAGVKRPADGRPRAINPPPSATPAPSFPLAPRAHAGERARGVCESLVRLSW